MQRSIKRPIGMALGGGASRGGAHVGVFQALQHYPQLFPDLISGSSVGAIAATLYACGLGIEEIAALAKKIRWLQDIIRLPGNDLSTTDFGFLSNSGLQELINKSVKGRTMGNTEIPLIITAGDMRQGIRVLFTDPYTAKTLRKEKLAALVPPPTAKLPGINTVIIDTVTDLGLMVCASCSIPQVFRPVKLHDFELSDGGILEQVPTNPLQAYGARTIIAVSLGLVFIEKNHILSPLFAMSAYSSIPAIRLSLQDADIPIHFKELEGTSLTQTGSTEVIDFAKNRARTIFKKFFQKKQ